MNNKKGKLPISIWIAIILFMFMSSMIGGAESMYMGLFLSNTVFKDGSMGAKITLTDTVNIIASLGAVISLITTFIMGTLSDKMKNRKIFISIGLITWGAVMFVFSGVELFNVARFFRIYAMGEIVTVTAAIAIFLSLVMAFLRSTTCDTAFNSWIVDISTPETSTIIEIIFTVMGFVTTGVITALVSNAQSKVMTYSDIFILLGAVSVALGFLGFVLIKNPTKEEENTRKIKKLRNAKRLNASSNNEKKEKESSYWSDLFYGFRASAVKENINLYLILSSGCLFNCACGVFMPYFYIYLDSVIFPANKNMEEIAGDVILTIILAIAAIAVSVLVLMKLYAKSKALSFIPSVICFVVGLFLASSTKSIIGFIIGLTPGLIGYIIIMIQFGATVRDNIPRDKVGLFQGIRMIFLGCIPGVIGPTIGNIAAKNSNVTYMENGAEKVLPTEAMFLYAAIVAVLIFIPMLSFLKKDRERALKEKN